jgi:hypothetical protein
VLAGPLVLAAALSSPGSPGATEARPATSFRHGISSVDAESLALKLTRMERRAPDAPPADPVVVTERELNSYLNLTTPPPLPPGLSDVEFRLERDRVEARGLVDIDRIRGKSSSGGWNPLALLGGWVEVQLKGRIPNRDGRGTIEVDEVRLGALSLPVSVLEQLVTAATKTEDNPAGFDLRAPFPLPYAAKQLRLQPGRLLLEF